MKIGVIILAAGNSSRFGSNKLLYEVEGIPMYQRILDAALGLKEKMPRISLTLVTQYEEIGVYAKKKNVQVLYNRHPEEGISSSVIMGLQKNLHTDACLFAVADQPWLTAETLCALIKAYQRSDKGIVCASHNGKMGNPCIFSSRYYGELLKLQGDTGGKKIARRHMEDVELLDGVEEKELRDVDVPGMAEEHR